MNTTAAPVRSIAALAQMALDVQDACNLSGVVHSLAGVFADLREHGVQNTNDLNQHPVVRLFTSKIVSLAMPGHELDLPYDIFSKDYAWAKDIIEASKKAA